MDDWAGLHSVKISENDLTIIMIFRETQLGRTTKGGFTLIEMIVSTSLFVTAMLLVVGAMVSLENASRKARTARIATDNVTAALDSMSRNIRMGTNFHCGCAGTLTTPLNCPMTDATGIGGDVCLAFESQGGSLLDTTDQYVYRLSGNRIERSTNSGGGYLALTAPEINISLLRFYVTGTEVSLRQPYVTMLVRGVATSSSKTTTTFDIQTTIGVRTPNFAP